MSRFWCNLSLAVGLTFLVGCDREPGTNSTSQNPLPPGSVAASSTENLPLVEHPEYANWSRFPVGIAVVRKKQVSNDAGTVHVTTTLRLIEKTTEKVVVQTQITVDRSGSPLVENPPFTADFPAKFRLPAGMQEDQFWLPSLKAKRIADVVGQACGRDYNTQLFTWDERNESGPMAVKLWRSDEIPGRMLRQEINGRNHISVEEVVELTLPGENGES